MAYREQSLVAIPLFCWNGMEIHIQLFHFVMVHKILYLVLPSEEVEDNWIKLLNQVPP